MEAAVERLAALTFLVTGLSHLLAPRAWVRFFERVAAQDEAAGIWNGFCICRSGSPSPLSIRFGKGRGWSSP